MRKLVLVAAAAAALMSASVANATTSLTFTFDPGASSVAFDPSANHRGVTVALASDLSSSFSLDVGQSRTIDFADFTFSNRATSTPLAGIGIDAVLALSSPSETASTSGTDWYLHTDQLKIGRFVIVPESTSGALAWSDPSTTFTTAAGDQFTVTFNDLVGIKVGGGDVVDTVTVKFDGVVLPAATSAAVPEPGSWALMIAGLGLSGFALRRQRSAAFQA